MSDAAIEPPAASPQTSGGSVTSTAVVALSGAGAGDTIMWLFDCFQQGHLVPPDKDLAMVWGAALMPLGHAFYRSLLKKLGTT